jgi:hypothetical protein
LRFFVQVPFIETDRFEQMFGLMIEKVLLAFCLSNREQDRWARHQLICLLERLRGGGEFAYCIGLGARLEVLTSLIKRIVLGVPNANYQRECYAHQ